MRGSPHTASLIDDLTVAYFFWEQLAVRHVLPMCTWHDVWQNAIVDKLLDYLALALCLASRQYAVGNAYNANWAWLLVVCNSAITTLTNRASVFSWAWHSEHLPKVINLSSIRVNHRHDGHNFKSKLWNCTKKKENCHNNEGDEQSTARHVRMLFTADELTTSCLFSSISKAHLRPSMPSVVKHFRSSFSTVKKSRLVKLVG